MGAADAGPDNVSDTVTLAEHVDVSISVAIANLVDITVAYPESDADHNRDFLGNTQSQDWITLVHDQRWNGGAERNTELQ